MPPASPIQVAATQITAMAQSRGAVGCARAMFHVKHQPRPVRFVQPFLLDYQEPAGHRQCRTATASGSPHAIATLMPRREFTTHGTARAARAGSGRKPDPDPMRNLLLFRVWERTARSTVSHHPAKVASHKDGTRNAVHADWQTTMITASPNIVSLSRVPPRASIVH